MIISIYENHIMSPSKCGSRFLGSIWENKETFNYVELLHKLPKVDYIVVRNPYEHFCSALQTDLLHIMNGEWNDTEIEIIDRYVSGVGPHYSFDLYKTIYEYWIETGKTATILPLHNLTEYVDTLGIPYNYNENDYDWKSIFDIWKSKYEIKNYVADKYPNEDTIMMNKLISEQSYFHKLLGV